MVEESEKLRGAWKDAFSLWARVFKRSWAWFFFAQAISVLASLGTSALQKYADSYVAVGIAVLIIAQLILIVFGLIIVNQIIDDVQAGRPDSDLATSIRRHIKYIFINFARTLLKTLFGFILFVIPGFVFWIQLTFVPYVVMFDPRFSEGKIDALRASENLVRGRFWRVGGILLLCIVLSMVPEFWLGSIKVFERPFLFVMVFFFGMVLELYGEVVTYCLYQRLTKRSH